MSERQETDLLHQPILGTDGLSARIIRRVQGPNPPISGTGVIGALGVGDAAAAHEHAVNADQAVLDEAELRELERAEYYPKDTVTSEPAVARQQRSLLDRLFRR